MDMKVLKQKMFPYPDRFENSKGFAPAGKTPAQILKQLRAIAGQEDGVWQTGKISGSLYSGEAAHYTLLNECFALFSHGNALQRDLCPSMSHFENEIIAMTLDMLHGDAVKKHDPKHRACGAVGSGGTESILTAMLAYRDRGRTEKGIKRPNIILPISAHPAFLKAAHYFGLDVIVAPIDPESMLVDVDFVRKKINGNTVALIGSAGSYPHGTIDPIAELSDLALEKGTWLHVDGCLGGWILPWGEQLGVPGIVPFDFRLPGVTSISADTHKFGYGLKGTSVLAWRDVSFRRYQYYKSPDWQGGMYASPGMAGSRSGGLIAATWASMVRLGKDGYLKRAKKIFDTAFKMQEAVRSHPELKIMGRPTFCFAMRSDAFDIYHLNDFMIGRGWRFNGALNPNALHMCVTGPQTQPGVVKTFRSDLADAVAYAHKPASPHARSGGVYGGGGAAGQVPPGALLDMLLDMATDGVPAAA
jgi:glutamate/tyrosine decarboxylase-like PLP-dependent enzyme